MLLILAKMSDIRLTAGVGTKPPEAVLDTILFEFRGTFREKIPLKPFKSFQTLTDIV